MKEPARQPIFDGHNDILERLLSRKKEGENASFFDRRDSGHLDWPRAREGGFAGGLFAMCVAPPAPVDGSAAKPPKPDLRPVGHTHALEMTRRMIEQSQLLEKEAEGRVRRCRSTAEIRDSLDKEVLAVVLHLEGAEAIDTDFRTLPELYSSGLRSLGLVWSRPNAFGCGVNFDFPGSPDQGPGLSDAGRELVRLCNRLGIMVDLSHLNEKGFWDVERISTAPLVATHSCAHALCRTPRNLIDKQLDAIKASQGVVGVNFGVRFLREDGARVEDTPLGVLARHFTYIAERIGADHVAMGSDFDGTTIPKELGDASGLPRLVAALQKSGLSREDLEKIAYKNWLRVLARAWNEA